MTASPFNNRAADDFAFKFETLKKRASSLRNNNRLLHALDAYEELLQHLTSQKRYGTASMTNECRLHFAECLNRAALQYSQLSTTAGTGEEKVRRLLSRAEDVLDPRGMGKLNSDDYRDMVSTTYNNMACHLKRCDKPHAAVTYLNLALEVESNRPVGCQAADAHLNLCVTLSDLGRHQEAAEHCQAALVLLQEEMAARPDPPLLKGDAVIKADLAKGGIRKAEAAEYQARAAVMSICFYNLGVEKEFLGQTGSAECFEKARETATTTARMGSSNPVMIQISQALIAAHNREQAAIGNVKEAAATSAAPLTLEQLAGPAGTEEVSQKDLPLWGMPCLPEEIEVAVASSIATGSIELVSDSFEAARSWGSTIGSPVCAKAKHMLMEHHSRRLDHTLRTIGPDDMLALRVAYSEACRFVPSEETVMERAHAVLFGRVDAMLVEMTGDEDKSADLLALVSWAYPDGLRFLGEKHRAVEDAAIMLKKKFSVDVSQPMMCYHASCDVLRYPQKQENGEDHCATCSQPFAIECIHCQERHVPLFISEAGCGLVGGQLVCPGCSRDHLITREATALCVSCRQVSYIRQSFSDQPGKSKCFSCGAARTWYCAECRTDTVTERNAADDEPICGELGCTCVLDMRQH